MLIWRGWGIVAVVLLFGGLLVAQLVVNAVAGEGTYEGNSQLYGGIGFVLGGVATFILGRWLERRNPPRQLIDPATGEQVELHTKNDFFWIPMTTWGLIGIVGGLILAVGGAFGVSFF